MELAHLEWGTMIELPARGRHGGEIAEAADFFSFGTNDLTQTAFGFSRDDIGKFVGHVRGAQARPGEPIRDVDRAGCRTADARSRWKRGAPPTRACTSGSAASTGATPRASSFCHEIGLDYVSCSPFRVETARLAAGQAAIGTAESASK